MIPPSLTPDFTASEEAHMRTVEQLLAQRRARPPRRCIRQTTETPMKADTWTIHLNTEQPTASSLLVSAADAIEARANLRDQPSGERSMARTVAAFNAMYGQHLTEENGWQFMALLKMARSSAGAFHVDDYTDQAAYSALAGECAAHAHTKPYAAT